MSTPLKHLEKLTNELEKTIADGHEDTFERHVAIEAIVYAVKKAKEIFREKN